MPTNSSVSFLQKKGEIVTEKMIFPDTHNEDGPLTLDQIPTEPDQEAPRVTRASVQKPSSQPLKRKKKALKLNSGSTIPFCFSIEPDDSQIEH